MNMKKIVTSLAGDRRSAYRYGVRVPFRYRNRQSGSCDYAAVAGNLSEMGIFFETEQQLRVGSVVDLEIEVPVAVRNGSVSSVHTICCGRVIRTETVNGRSAVAVQFIYYDIDSSAPQPTEVSKGSV